MSLNHPWGVLVDLFVLGWGDLVEPKGPPPNLAEFGRGVTTLEDHGAG